MAEQRNGAVALDQGTLEIIAFRLNGQQFCVLTKTVREIRGWSPSTPMPHSPPSVIGIMNLRGSIVPIIDLSRELGMPPSIPNERSAIVVADVHSMILGLLVDQVSDILTVREDQVQPLPEAAALFDRGFSDGIITHGQSMTFFLNLANMFQAKDLISTGG